MKVHQMIEIIRKKQGITQKEISQALDKDVSWYTRIAKGQLKLDAELLVPIAEILGVSVSNFFYKSQTDYENELQAVYGRLNQIRDLVNKEIY